MLRQRTQVMRTSKRFFSTAQTGEELAKPKLKPTPAAGFKVAKPKKGEELIGQRVYGDTNIFTSPTNYNFEMRRRNEERTKIQLLKLLGILSLIPIAKLVMNAEKNLKSTGAKELSSKRRERLDEEYGVDRSTMKGDFERLDELYRVSEKEEIEKYNRIGKSTKQFYEEKTMREQLEEQKKTEGEGASVEKMKEILLQKQNLESGTFTIKSKEGSGYS